MEYKSLIYEVRDGVALITLAREERLNALNSDMNRELPLVWRHFEADDNAQVAIVTGQGPKAFCVGADLNDLPKSDDDPTAGTLQSIKWSSLQNEVWKPVIAAVNGMAVGGGLHFIADADIVVASETATFFDSHVAIGFASALEPIALCRRMPIGAVLRMALMGGAERLGAQEALRLGLVDEVTPAGELLDRAFAMANKIRRHSPSALARTKKAIWQAQDMGLNQALQHGWKLLIAQSAHPDAAEGPQAFGQHRRPNWQPYSALLDVPSDGDV
jgi:enoyl-CoA hydratase/carnithine racemase